MNALPPSNADPARARLRAPASSVNPGFGGCLPTPEQELLLRAALWRGADALAAWEEWREQVDLDAIDPGSKRLLPQLYFNLRAQRITHPWMEKFKEVYRTAWLENQKHFERAAPALRALNAAGIPTIALKGAALIAHYYKDFGVRPIGDFDVLVPTPQRAAATAILIQLGWTKREYVPIYNSCAFAHANGGEIDLHWHLLSECLDANADADFWQGAISARVGDVPMSILNSADMLLHICVHGFRWNATPPIRWVADALTIFNSAPDDLDWERLIAQAQKRELVLVMRHALGYLRDEMNAPVPGAVMPRLDATRVSRLERTDYAARTIPPQMFGVQLYWVGYVRLAKKSELGLFGLLEYLRRVWDLEHVWQVPLFACSRAVRELRFKMQMARWSKPAH